MKTTLWFLIVLGGIVHVSTDSFAQSMYLSPDTTRWTAPKSAETPADALPHQPTSRALTNIEEFGIGEDVVVFWVVPDIIIAEIKIEIVLGRGGICFARREVRRHV